MNKLDKIRLAWYSSYKLNKFREKIRSFLFPSKFTNIIFIFGCQRSGTTIIQRILSLNPNVKFQGEGDPPYFHDPDGEKHHRFESFKKINNSLNQESLSSIVLKPLYESHNANDLINTHKKSKGIWVFRNYQDVVDSHLHYYEYNVKNYVRPLFDKTENNWLNEYISDDIKTFIAKFDLENISDADAYAIFWIARNSLFLNVKDNKNILLVNYEKLITNPTNQISRFCKFTGLPYYKFYSKIIKSNAMSKKVNFTLSPEIENKCKDTYNSLLEYS